MTAAAFAVAAAVAVSACSASNASGAAGGDGSATSRSQFVPGTGEITTVAPARRTVAPALSGKSLTGKPLRLSDYHGKVVLINVWGSWCDPCRAEAPGLEAVYRALQGQGVQFVGIDTRDLSTGPALAFERTFKLSYPSFYDPDGALLARFPAGTLNPQAIPSTLVLDRRGRIAARALQPLTEDELRSVLKPVLAEKP